MAHDGCDHDEDHGDNRKDDDCGHLHLAGEDILKCFASDNLDRECIAGEALDEAHNVAGDGQHSGDVAEHGSGADLAAADLADAQQTEQTRKDAGDGCEQHAGADQHSANDFIRDRVGLVLLNVVAAGDGDLLRHVEVEELAAVHNENLPVFVELPVGEVFTQALFADGSHAGADDLVAFTLVVSVFRLAQQRLQTSRDLRCAVLKHGELCLAVRQILRALLELCLAFGIGSLTGGVCGVARIQRLLCFGKLGFTLSDGLFGLSKLSNAGFIRRHLRMAFGDHGLDVGREVRHIARNGQSHLGCERTHDADEPDLCVFETGEVGDAGIAPCNVLINVRHQGVNLLKHGLAFVVSGGIRFDRGLPFGVGLLAGFELCYAFVIGGLTGDELWFILRELCAAGCQSCLTFLIRYQAGFIRTDTGGIGVFVFLELCDAGQQMIIDLLKAFLCVMLLIFLDIQGILHSVHTGEQTEHTGRNQADADDGE